MTDNLLTGDGCIAITLGQPFYRRMEEGCQFNYYPPYFPNDPEAAPSCELVLGFNKPHDYEIKGFHDGVAEFLLVELESITFVCVRFTLMESRRKRLSQNLAIGWQECAVHPVAANKYVPNSPEPPGRWLLTAVLVDTSTRRVSGLRAFTLGTEFCQAFAGAMSNCRSGFDSLQSYMAALKNLYGRYAIGEVIKKGRLLGHCLGGD